jgi:hypothetical protein
LTAGLCTPGRTAAVVWEGGTEPVTRRRWRWNLRRTDLDVTRLSTACLSALVLIAACAAPAARQGALFDVREFGASGRAADDARPAIQRAIDACAAAGGGTVVFPPGEYTSGSIELRSHVRVYLEPGATVFSAKGKEAFPTGALFHGEDLVDVALEGSGTLDGRAAYEWRANDHEDAYIAPNLRRMQALGKPLLRPFPTSDSAGHLVRLVRCTDVLIRDLSFRRSPSWNVHLWGCERVVIDGVDIRSDLREAVWSDGIDPDGCRDVRISNSVIETGDDALVFYSTDLFGPARPCEDIVVTNCRLTSSSSALKFCDGNQECVRRVAISNCAITNSNRGLAFMVFDGGYVSDVVISTLTIECTRRDWFWWGEGDPIHFNVKRRSEVDGRPREKERPAGSIRDVTLRGVIARGTGECSISGHPDSPLEGLTIEGLRLHLALDPAAPYETAERGLSVQHARGLELRDVEIVWDAPASPLWKNALAVADVQGLWIDGLVAGSPPSAPGAPAVHLDRVATGALRGSRALPGTKTFVHAAGEACRDLWLDGNDLREAEIPWSAESDALREQAFPPRR